MDFMKILKSLEEFVYEFVSWLIFYPLTMWRSVRRPQQMMDYAAAELRNDSADQYADTMSPPLFLWLTMLIALGVEIALIPSAAEALISGKTVRLVNSEQNVLVFRTVLFSVYPIVLATALTRRQGIALDRNTLRPHFFSQCFLTAPFAFGASFASTLWLAPWWWSDPASMALLAIVVIWYCVQQARWFARHLSVNRLRAAWIAGIALIQATVAALLMAGAVALF